jgi:hypothetical protein
MARRRAPFETLLHPTRLAGTKHVPAVLIPASPKTWIDEAERRTWFLFESTRAAEEPK